MTLTAFLSLALIVLCVLFVWKYLTLKTKLEKLTEKYDNSERQRKSLLKENFYTLCVEHKKMKVTQEYADAFPEYPVITENETRYEAVFTSNGKSFPIFVGAEISSWMSFSDGRRTTSGFCPTDKMISKEEYLELVDKFFDDQKISEKN